MERKMSRLLENPAPPTTEVTERLRRQLLWAFDALGQLNGDRFLTILLHEHVALPCEEMLELASQLTPPARRAASPSNN
jgi:hypothetical protein